MIGYSASVFEFAADAAKDDSRAFSFLLVPEGAVDLAGSEPLVMNEEHGEATARGFRDRGVDMPVDFEHSTIFRAAKGEPSPAAGWIKSLEFRKGAGLVVSGTWNERAAELIRSGEYRYFSPVYHFDKKTRGVSGISSVALTNTPRMKNLKALAASAACLEDVSMTATATKKKPEKKDDDGTLAAMDEAPDVMASDPIIDLAMLLGEAGITIEEGANHETVLKKAIEFIKSKLGGSDDSGDDADDADGDDSEGASTLFATLGAKTSEEAILMLKSKYVPREEHDAALGRLDAIENENQARVIASKIDGYVTENKLNPNDEAQMAAASKMAEKDFDGWVEFMDATTPSIAPGRVTSDTAGDGNGRASVIAASVTEFDNNKGRLVGIDRAAFVNQSLREKDLGLLTEDEKSKIG